MDKQELQREIVRTILDYYQADDDAESYGNELRELEDEREGMDEDLYNEKEHELVSAQNQEQCQAQYLYTYLEDYFLQWQELTGETVNLESFEHLLD